MAEHRTPNRYTSRAPCSFECWFKKRLPPTPTLQAGYLWGCYEKLPSMARGRGRKTKEFYSFDKEKIASELKLSPNRRDLSIASGELSCSIQQVALRPAPHRGLPPIARRGRDNHCRWI